MIPADEMAAMRTEVAITFDTPATPLIFDTDPDVDDYGNEQETWDAGDDILIQLRHGASREVTTDRDTQITEWYARLPVTSTLTGRDRLQVEDDTYEIVGKPTDEITHRKAQLILVDG